MMRIVLHLKFNGRMLDKIFQKGSGMVKVSVIVPVYNCRKYLKHTIASIENQTYKNWEVLIVDDASTDGSAEEIDRLAADNPKIKVWHLSENHGVSYCRNFAMEQAEGRYLAFLDADDLWSKDKLSQQLFVMERDNLALSHTGYAFMNEKGFVLPVGKVQTDQQLDLASYMKTTQIGMSTVMIDRKKAGAFHFPEDRELCEDARVWMHFLRKGMNFSGINDVLTLYRVRSNQLSKNKMKMAVNTLKRYWNERNLSAYKRLWYFINYAYNGARKRLQRSQLDLALLQKFNCNR